jgi:hypothetical protein
MPSAHDREAEHLGVDRERVEQAFAARAVLAAHHARRRAAVLRPSQALAQARASFVETDQARRGQIRLRQLTLAVDRQIAAIAISCAATSASWRGRSLTSRLSCPLFVRS